MFSIINIILALAGATLCYKIYKKKKKPEPMVCMIGADCGTVLHSDYSKMFGIPLEFYGLVYYLLTAIAYASVLLIPSLQMTVTYFALWIISMGAFLFSIYLISIQAFVIKSWCTWCLTSALLTTAIFISSTLSRLWII